jgi:hypothetical protein
MDSLVFVTATVSLLATPGPTNTLLATSGASAGLRRSAHLLIAELGGYLIAIVLLRSLLGPLYCGRSGLGDRVSADGRALPRLTGENALAAREPRNVRQYPCYFQIVGRIDRHSLV